MIAIFIYTALKILVIATAITVFLPCLNQKLQINPIRYYKTQKYKMSYEF